MFTAWLLAASLLGGCIEATSPSAAATTAPLSRDQVKEFQREGLVVVRGMLQGDDLRRAQRAAKKINGRFPSLLALVTGAYRSIEFQAWRCSDALESVAFDSSAGAMAAQCMGLREDEPVRLLKDALLSFEPSNKGCGWHVDDKHFWPCKDSRPGNQRAGVNVWIALSPIRADEGGGLAVAPRSHRLRWRERCRKTIAGTDGGGTGPARTCDMEKLDSRCFQRLESLKTLHDMEPGDAIIHDRYLFHRAESFADPKSKSPPLLRYSIRFMPSDSELFNNGNEHAIEAKALDTGAPLEQAGEYYPQVWPSSIPAERAARRLGKVKQDRKLLTPVRALQFAAMQLKTQKQ